MCRQSRTYLEFCFNANHRNILFPICWGLSGPREWLNTTCAEPMFGKVQTASNQLFGDGNCSQWSHQVGCSVFSRLTLDLCNAKHNTSQLHPEFPSPAEMLLLNDSACVCGQHTQKLDNEIWKTTKRFLPLSEPNLCMLWSTNRRQYWKQQRQNCQKQTGWLKHEITCKYLCVCTHMILGKIHIIDPWLILLKSILQTSVSERRCAASALKSSVLRDASRIHVSDVRSW